MPKLGFFAAANALTDQLAAGTLAPERLSRGPDADLQPAAGWLADGRASC